MFVKRGKSWLLSFTDGSAKLSNPNCQLSNLYRCFDNCLNFKLIFEISIFVVKVTELEAEFEKLGNEKPQQTRFLRSQQDLKAKMEARMAEGTDTNEGNMAPVLR